MLDLDGPRLLTDRLDDALAPAVGRCARQENDIWIVVGDGHPGRLDGVAVDDLCMGGDTRGSQRVDDGSRALNRGLALGDCLIRPGRTGDTGRSQDGRANGAAVGGAGLERGDRGHRRGRMRR